MSQDDRALTAKSVAHLCGLFSRDAWHAEHVTHSDLASIVNGEFIFIFVWAISMTWFFFTIAFAEVPEVLEAEHCGDFTKTARRALRELAKPVEAHAEAFTPAEVSVIYLLVARTFRKPPVESSFLCFVFPLLIAIKDSILVGRALRGAFGVPSSR